MELDERYVKSEKSRVPPISEGLSQPALQQIKSKIKSNRRFSIEFDSDKKDGIELNEMTEGI